MRNIFGILAVVLMLFIGCDKDKDRTSLLGGWNCEEFPEQTLPRNYQVSIMRNPYIQNKTNEYIINNFYNLGNSQNSEVYFYQDTVSKQLIIKSQIVQGYSIYGTGTVAYDFSRINWEYHVSSGVVDEKVIANYY